MSSKDAHLYSAPGHTKNAKKPGRDIETSSTLAFTSQLSGLISSAKTSGRPAAGRAHKKKEDIFATHNRNSAKRAKKDVEDFEDGRGRGTGKKAGGSGNSEAVDDAAWARSKRKMEEKARLYAAMKRGDLEDEEGKLMVDFDTKWAAGQDAKGEEDRRWDNESSEGSDVEVEEVVEWEDEFGRTKKGTRTDMLREQRRNQLQEEVAERKRPRAPDKVIWGDTVQAAAFNPERNIQDKMEELARKRDKSLTPPPDTHFDASREVRSKGVGFMQLSLDADERKKQMDELVEEREQTERKRSGRDQMMEERRRKLEERKKQIQEKRGKRKADEFLDGLEKEMATQQDEQDAT
ncbi:hypothetical protein B9Z65_4801 [Elsinoe australis]|uniref:Uncharacterized protein n=1 Tax=Elsinoe australis TaxID=40998 RepID=A0A2P8A656_9PEZI|nr:hypothetical protein B9Z65_4801 [Elsinoe australis]